jgi:pre-mRNA-splicing factor ATP-dependent RNA helicase DHX38/PRP16
MFFSVKDRNFSHRDMRRENKLDKEAMEERLIIAQKKQKEDDAKIAAETMTPRSRIATPGARTPSLRREPGTPRRTGRIGL